MPPIKTFTNSPINAAKPSGITPQTTQSQEEQRNTALPPTTATSQQSSYPAAQPAAVPSLPLPTSSYNTGAYQPTPTRDTSSGSPPPPQPGAVPVPPSASTLPPPPKAGEKLPSHLPSTTTTMPPQMSYSLPGTIAPAYSSTSTAQTQGYPGGPSQPATLMEGGMGGSSSGQQQQPLVYQQRSYDNTNDNTYDSQDESVWGTAKKWAYAAGDSLAKAENEVWKRINKD